MQWFGNRFKIFGRLRDKRAEEPERAAAQAQTAAETKTKQESDIQERGMKMVIIAGLGNPTKEYENTRHNIGFMAIDALADKYHISVMDCKHKALIGKGVIGGTKVVLVKPERFENASEIADQLKDKRTVVLNLESTNKDVARRLIDFLSGVAYAGEGKIKKVAANTYIITPYHVDIEGDLIDELENNGLYF